MTLFPRSLPHCDARNSPPRASRIARALTRQVIVPLMGVTIALVGLPAGTAAAAPKAPLVPMLGPADGVVRQNAVNDPIALDRVLGYWTPERMAAAEPSDQLVDTSPPGSAADEKEKRAAPSANSRGERWNGGGKITKTTGRVYLTMNGSDFTCSATVVDAQNKDTLVTAAHCLKDGKGAWAENWTFIPGYRNGDEPLGRYVARELLVAPQWSQQANDSFDFGMAVLNPAKGAHVAQRTGTQKIGFNAGTAGTRYAFGYPASGRFNGRELHYCSGPTRPDRRGTQSAGMACQMTEGSSGGPWLSDFDTRTGTGTVTSVVSFKYANDSSTQYGPRLGPEAEKLYNAAQKM